jgi:glycosyltransferase involved in cell wall biosynthesis
MKSDRRHVLFVIDILYSSAGGAEGILAKIVRELPAHGYRCSVITLASRPDLVKAEHFDCPVYCFPVRSLWGVQALAAAWKFARFIRRERVDVVHTFFEASDLLGGVVAKLCGRMVVSSRRDMGFRRSRIQRVGYRVAAPVFDAVHAVAEEVRRAHIAQDRLDPRKVVTVHNGVDLRLLDRATPSLPPEFGIPAGCPIVVCVGNIRAVKGFEYLARTVATVCRERPDVRFLVIGEVHDPPYFERVQQSIRDAGCSGNVVFAGCRSDVPAILKTCSVFYMCSLSEGLSNALLEAMACGLPCVATKVGGNAEVVDDGRSGYLVPARDPERAARRIIELLSDQTLGSEMGRTGRAIVEARFSMRVMIDAVLDSYRRLLSDGRVPRHSWRSQTQLSGD